MHQDFLSGQLWAQFTMGPHGASCFNFSSLYSTENFRFFSYFCLLYLDFMVKIRKVTGLFIIIIISAIRRPLMNIGLPERTPQGPLALLFLC